MLEDPRLTQAESGRIISRHGRNACDLPDQVLLDTKMAGQTVWERSISVDRAFSFCSRTTCKILPAPRPEVSGRKVVVAVGGREDWHFDPSLAVY